MKEKHALFLCLFITLITFLTALLISCSAEQSASEIVNFFDMKDCQAPELLQINCTSPTTVTLVFDEDVFPLENSFNVSSVTAEGSVLNAELVNSLSPSSYYDLTGRVEDSFGNSTYFSARVWGYNENPATAVINEFTTKGTSTQSDRTELLITRGGNTAGLTLYDGVPSDSKKAVVLPSAELEAGDYVVIYWTEELPSSAVSTDSVLYLCSGTEASLSDDNGILTLSSSPVQGSAVLDCVIYCSFESTQYEGYGTKAVLNRVNKALENAWWYSNAVDSSKSTSTRSICRKLNSTDTDTASDWYTVTTKGLSFGSANTSEAYSPQKKRN